MKISLAGKYVSQCIVSKINHLCSLLDYFIDFLLLHLLENDFSYELKDI